MIKVWLLVMFMHSPTLPNVKYNAIMYKTDDQCMNALANYLNMYEKKSDEYKSRVVTDAHCIPFNSFTIKIGI